MEPSTDGRGKQRRAAVMDDVAELAGVSAMTVSRVLNHPEKVRAATRNRVLEVVRELDYRPNNAARVLSTGRSRVLGVVSFDTTLYGPASTLNGIERAAHEYGHSISIASLSSLNRRTIGEGADRLRGQSVDGIIIVAPHESAAESLRDLPPELPVVAVGAAQEIPFPVASVDQHAGAVQATEHLLALGHATVWHISGPKNWVDAHGRVNGWRQALQAQDREIPLTLNGDWSAQSGYHLGKQIATDHAITAIFAGNDAMALGLLRALREAGRRVPEDVSVVGFDNVPESGYFAPPLTTVHQNFKEVGRKAYTMMLDRINDPERDPRTRHIVKTDLVVRESTARST